MTIWCGIEFSTENRQDVRVVEMFQQEIHAVRWREKLGPRGEGQPFSSANGHKLVRSVYRMPHGWRSDRRGTKAELAWKVSSAGTFVVPI